MYKDISFKLKPNAVTGVTMIEGLACINQSLINIMNTTPGERIGDPDFGCNIKRYLFEKINYITASGIRNELKNVVGSYEPRITINEVTVNPNYDLNQYDVFINYSIKDIQGDTTFAIGLSVQE